MRPSRTVARAALTAVLALGALPGLVGSHEPTRDKPIDAALFDQVNLATTRDRQTQGDIVLDAAGRSDGALGLTDSFPDAVAGNLLGEGGRAQPGLPATKVAATWRAARQTMTGFASFYDNGTTAMRIPRGTTVVICGRGGCVERVINDYGPAVSTGRVVDMDRPDFFRVCGCGWWSGTTTVTIRIY
jgi:hypothetical protein